jgi:hypothetical protein
MAILQALLGRFVDGTQYFTMNSDYTWTLHGQVTPNAAANQVAGSFHDIILYGSQLLAQIMQVMVAPNIAT